MTVDEEVTFCNQINNTPRVAEGRAIYNGRNSEFFLLGVFEELENIIPDDNARLPSENTGGHVAEGYSTRSEIDAAREWKKSRRRE